jgi:glycine cleavage system aminomethyltransferase T
LTGIRLTERGFPRPGHEVVYGGRSAGPVRSGTVGPSLGYGIATAYLQGRRRGDADALLHGRVSAAMRGAVGIAARR